jgi:GTPase
VVSLNLVPVVDVLGGVAVDATMVATLSHLYGLQMSWTHARRLVSSIVQAAGWVMLAEVSTHFASMAFKALTLGYGTVLTAVPQGAAAGYGSYIVGQAAKYFFEHGASWGPEGPKTVVKRILDETDKQSVLDRLKEEIRKKLTLNRHAEKDAEGER